MQLTLHVPDDLAADLRRHQARLPRILRKAKIRAAQQLQRS
ncbi:hypothetical protein [Thiohalocapsa sp. ML1]|jgi:hypothetical protein|nr:hypothetical protein [Thiohalocapsa sp. ML1]